jgi:hypothetical protein
MHEMRIQVITALFVFIELLVCDSIVQAEQKDVLLVVLEDDKGQRSLHYQPSPHESCSSFLGDLRKARKENVSITLTFEAPPKVTGRVVDAFCMHPDGSTQTICDGTITRHSLQGYTAIARNGLGECIFAADSHSGQKDSKGLPYGLSMRR